MPYSILKLNLTAGGRLHVITSENVDELFPKHELLRDNQKSLVCLPSFFSLEFVVFAFIL